MEPNGDGAGVPWRFEVCALRERAKITTQNVKGRVLFWVIVEVSVSEENGNEKPLQKESVKTQPSLRDLKTSFRGFPALKRWANVRRPCAAGFFASALPLACTELPFATDSKGSAGRSWGHCVGLGGEGQ